MTDESTISKLGEWLATPPGEYVRAWEQAQFDAMVADVFGYQAWQVGMPQLDALKDNRMPFKAYAGLVLPGKGTGAWQAQIQADPEALPFDAQSIDLLVLPHVLEFASRPHEVLREVDRVLVPEGRVVISGFNPWSLWGLRESIPGIDPWLPHAQAAQVSLVRLRDWFKLLGFEAERGRYGCYAPPCRTETWLQRWHFMESAGERWWPFCGAVYAVSAVKKVQGVRLIGQPWKKKKRRMPRGARVAGAASMEPAVAPQALPARDMPVDKDNR
ncbi:class I SAM-dependent methyltransferase [Kerstersia gyiorum]|uniref:class I SAM-dependent methyltransferase n=1 Tax=Kerstersia gyiorum TaxID=206506 RepID=UPI000FDA8028|nr:class I SAM-dependent methyltransferase [Kerstersia gyiorum]AZV94935.1 SAM-dependent methyltransferase [Bordetella sp. J329]MCP1632177.1 SAM-dependent methyltransferase [Kerstersia gyiorum]MCP1635316.1 SAM-dependent methyltransferase [Kerstersia gyiorum]MCP1669757.1 SAM-dependent methyltransferase [Kerstersia gyiorum]MCP1677894.1 SAM-dependent methyltransferase [Kerstersia gyiorum]